MRILNRLLAVATLLAANTHSFAQNYQAQYDTANYVMTDRQVSNFSKIHIQGPFDVYVTQGTTESVKLNAPAEILDRMVTTVNGSTLSIHNKHDNWSNGFKSWYSDKSWWHTHKRISVYITANNINGIKVSGSGRIFLTTPVSAASLKLIMHGSGQINGKVDVTTLKSHMSGSAHIALSGVAKTSTIKISGSGRFSARDLVTLSSKIHVSGSGHADINASNEVDAVVHGSAYVGYTGSPKMISTSKSGSGVVSRL